MCNCVESKTHGIPNDLNVHNCEYIALRNSHIPAAGALPASARRETRLTGRRFLFGRWMNELMRGGDHREDSHKPSDTQPANDPVQVLLRASK
jgi:hypothetical protein